MKISEERKSKLYDAISEPIMQLRIDLQRYGSLNSELLDSKLFKVEADIWREVHKILNLEGHY